MVLSVVEDEESFTSEWRVPEKHFFFNTQDLFFLNLLFVLSSNDPMIILTPTIP